MSKPFTILVLCTANLCRSPMAEAVFSVLGRPYGDKVFSAGLAARSGIVQHRLASQAITALGYPPLSGKRSHLLSRRDLQLADLVLVMERKHKSNIQMKFPMASGKTFLLGHWQNIEIADPIGRNAQFFMVVARQIEAACLAWMQHIERPKDIS